jgi:hypothetical protein
LPFRAALSPSLGRQCHYPYPHITLNTALLSGPLWKDFRARAEEIRARAETMHDAVLRQKMRQIAGGYERLGMAGGKKFGEADNRRQLIPWRTSLRVLTRALIRF